MTAASLPISTAPVPTDLASLRPDPDLPALALFGQPESAADTLNRLLSELLGRDRVRETRASVRRYVPGKRCILEVEILTGGGRSRRLLAKLYNKDQGARAFETLSALRSAGFGNGPLKVPEPLAYDPDQRLLILEWVQGTSLRSLLAARACVPAEMEGAAAWLAKLHRCGVRGGRAYTFERHLHTMRGWKTRMAQACPEAQPLLEELLERIEHQARNLPHWIPAPTHRDYSPDHVVADGGRFTALDFDEFCQYDPAFDVAHFLTHLRYLSLIEHSSPDRLEPMAVHFLSAYRAEAGALPAARLRFYRATACFKLARIVCLVLRPPAWENKLRILLSEARRLLEE